MLLLEDDAVPCDDFDDRYRRFMDAVPDDWGLIYLGGEHLGNQRPVVVNELVYQPYNVNRTHAWAIHRRMIKKVYHHLLRRDWHKGHHIDWHMGRLHQRRQDPVYCPNKWLIGQAEGRSTIAHRQFPERFFPNADAFSQLDRPYVMVLGLHNSGSSALAGVIHKLGVSMGDLWAPAAHDKNGGGFEARYLAKLCERLMPFPSTQLKVPERAVAPALLKWMNSRKGIRLGMKYPHLCYFAQFLPDVQVIHADRPLAESVRGLQRRERGRTCERKCRTIQTYLEGHKRAYLQSHDHLNVKYADLLKDPRGQIERLCHYLDISPTETQMEEAEAHILQRSQLQ